MKRQAHEVYGSGPRLSTVEDKAARLARRLLMAFCAAVLAATVLVSNGVIAPW